MTSTETAAEEVASEIPEDLVYDAADECLQRTYSDGELSRTCTLLHGSLGFPSHRRSNLHLLRAPDTLVYASGNAVVLLALDGSGEKRLLRGHRCWVTALSVHPSGKFVAVGEGGETQAQTAAIFIYSWPQLQVVRVLQGGSERTYSDLVFNGSGTRLASVGGAPDFLLIIWDWRQQKVLLRTKAFSQDVFRVHFSPFSEGELVTSGTGHIRFWKMARTFTGLKLKGEIGKFGKVELSDVAAVAQLPDGKVISSTENGSLLVWDDNIIQFTIRRLLDDDDAASSSPSDAACHSGMVEYLELRNNELISGGQDGFVRVWDTTALNYAEVPETDPFVRLRPTRSYNLGANVAIIGMLRCSDTDYIVQDGSGALHRLTFMNEDADDQHEEKNGFRLSTLSRFHSSAVTAVAPRARSHEAASGGADSSVRFWDMLTARCVFERHFPHAGGVSALQWAPHKLDADQNILFAAFGDGVVRVLYRHADAFSLVGVVKPHRDAIVSMALSPDGAVLATAARDRTVFFIGVAPANDGAVPSVSLTPIGFVEVNEGVPTSLSWRHDGELLSMGAGSHVVQMQRPTPDECDTTSSFRLALAYTAFQHDLSLTTSPIERRRQLAAALALAEQREREKAEAEADADAGDGAEVETAVAKVAPIDVGERNADVLAALKAPTLVDGGGGGGAAEHVGLHTSNVGDAVADADRGGGGGGDGGGDGGGGGGGGDFVCPDVCSVLHGPGASLFVCFGKSFGPRVFEFDDQNAVVSTIELSGDGEVTCMSVNTVSDGAVELTVALSDGVIELHELSAQRSARFLRVSTHGGDGSDSVQAARSFDGTLLLTASGDGSMSVYRVSLQKALECAALDIGDNELEMEDVDTLVGALPTPVLSETMPAGAHDPAGDICSVDAYSLEEAKLKAERDNDLALAAQKKTTLKQQIAVMREEFVQLARLNRSLDVAHRVPPDVLQVDDKLVERLERQSALQVEQAKRELAWHEERHALALRKLRDHFLSHVLVERIEMKALRRDVTVVSFRTSELSDSLKAALADVHALIDQQSAALQQPDDDSSDQLQACNDAPSSNSNSNSSSRCSRRSEQQQQPQQQHQRCRQKEGETTAEGRRLERQRRNEKRIELERQKPAEDADDPRDVEAIRDAETHMGDYKLKSDVNYIVPEEQRVNADQKRRQMLLMLESLQCIRMGLNERFLALRDLKRRLVDSVKKDNVRVREINAALGIDRDDELFEPEMSDSEWPERREQFNRSDLRRFERELERRQKEKEQANKGNNAFGGGGEDEGGSGAVDGDGDGESKRNDASDSAATEGGRVDNGSGYSEDDSTGSTSSYSDADADEVVEVDDASREPLPESSGTQLDVDEQKRRLAIRSELLAGLKASKMQKRADQERRQLLLHEKQTIVDKINSTVDAFDDAIEDMRREKFLLDADLKSADLKMLSLRQELDLLRSFETREKALNGELAKARADKAQVVLDLTDCQERLATRLQEITEWKEKNKSIANSFEVAVGSDKHPSYAALLKIFKRKMKRTKKKNGGGDADAGGSNSDADADDTSDDDNDDDESDEGYYDDESESSSDEEEDTCPPDCDAATYEKVLELREKRLDQEEVLVDFNRAVDELKTMNERFQLKEKSVDKELRNIELAIEAFQTEKQQALNRIPAVVPLRLTQIQCLQQQSSDAVATLETALEDGGKRRPTLPSDISHTLVLTRAALSRLHRRIMELQDEKGSLRKQYNDLKREHKSLTRELKQMQSKIGVERKKCEDVQILKFGRLIDLDKLEQASTNTAADELSERLKELERQWLAELSTLSQQIRQAQRERRAVTAENTRRLHLVAALTQQQYELEDQLNAASAAVHVVDSAPGQRREAQERLQLVHLVRGQSDEIDDLKAEVAMLRRKGGYLYGPAPNTPAPAASVAAAAGAQRRQKRSMPQRAPGEAAADAEQ